LACVPWPHRSGHTATYEVAVLAEWEDALGVGLTETPADLATLGPQFGAAHLFIDDCSDSDIYCFEGHSQTLVDQGMCWNYLTCMPCEPYGHVQPDRCATAHYWSDKCTKAFAGCNGWCMADTSSSYGGGFAQLGAYGC